MSEIGDTNILIGVKEYIDFPGMKYDPSIGILGFDVCVTINRKGKRITRRKIKKRKMGRKHLVQTDESQEFIKQKFKIDITEAE